MKLRKRTHINYCEPEEPHLDEYLYCDKCEDLVYEYCSVHGPLLVVPDDNVPENTGYPDYVPRAALTIPHVFLHIAPSDILPGAGLGVFSTVTLPHGVRFGPYLGRDTTMVDSTYCWQLYNDKRVRNKVVDAADPNISNWMRYVNCSRHWREQNLVAYQYQGQIYYRTIKIIPPHTELLVFYGGQFARLLGINLKYYNSAEYYPVKVTETPMIMLTEINNNEYFTETLHSMFEIDNNSYNVTTDACTDDAAEVKHVDCNTYRANTNSPITVTYDREARRFQIEFHNMINIESNNATTDTNVIANEHNKVITNDSSSGQRFASTSYNDTKPSNNYAKDKIKECHICGRVLSKKSNFGRHLATHDTNKINNKCNVCGKIFSEKQYLKSHMLTHFSEYAIQNSYVDLGDAMFKCKICQKMLGSRTSLSHHIFLSHFRIDDNAMSENITIRESAESYYKCSSCDYKTQIYADLTQHTLTEHSGKFKNCHICNRMISRKGFYRHCKVVHKQFGN